MARACLVLIQRWECVRLASTGFGGRRVAVGKSRRSSLVSREAEGGRAAYLGL